MALQYKLSPQQLAVLRFPSEFPGRSLNVIARAGAGKTSTAIELAKVLPGKGFIGAFNKSIADELAVKIRGSYSVKAGTWHSIGLFLFRQVNNSFTIEGKKMHKIVKSFFDPYSKTAIPHSRKLGEFTRDLVSYAKQCCYGLEGSAAITDYKAWNDLADYYDMWDDLPVGPFEQEATEEELKKSKSLMLLSRMDLIGTCMRVYQLSLDACIAKVGAEIDFDDMILAPLYFNKFAAPMFDWVIIDEAQDTNEARRRLARAVLRPGGIMVAVGDPAQAIYGFAGASSNSMDLIKGDMDSLELPLTVTYRCPKSVVTLAQTWVADIQAHETNKAGEVESMGAEDFFKTIFVPSQDVILCRNTRPLIGIAKHLRQIGTPCVVEGVNHKGILALAGKWGEDISVEVMLTCLDEYAETEFNRLQVKDAQKADKFKEKVEIVQDFAHELSPNTRVSKLLTNIERMLGFTADDRNDVLTLCTVHRSKGREWHRVFLIGRSVYMPSKWAKAKWEHEQEKNLMYVAVTRSKHRLVEVQVPLKKKRTQQDWWDNPRAADIESGWAENITPQEADKKHDEEDRGYEGGGNGDSWG